MSVIDDYLLNMSGPNRRELERIRSIIRESLPEATEVITYGMPGFKYNGKYLVAFNTFRDHLGLFPTSGPIETFKDRLKDYKTSKGGIQFTAGHPLPKSLIKDILAARVAQLSGN